MTWTGDARGKIEERKRNTIYIEIQQKSSINESVCVCGGGGGGGGGGGRMVKK